MEDFKNDKDVENKVENILENHRFSEFEQEILEDITLGNNNEDPYKSEFYTKRAKTKIIENRFLLSQDFINLPEVNNILTDIISGYLYNHLIPQVLEFKKDLNLTEDIFKSPKLKEYIFNITKNAIYRYEYSFALDLIKNFNTGYDILQSPTIREYFKKNILEAFVRNYHAKYFNQGLLGFIKEVFNWNEDVYINFFTEEIIPNLLPKDILNFSKVKERFGIPDEILQLPQVQKVVKGIIVLYPSFERMKKIKEEFELSEEVFQEIMDEVIMKKIIDRRLESDLITESDTYFLKSIQSSQIKEIAKKQIIKDISDGYIDSALRVKKVVKLPEEIFQSPEVQEAAKAIIMTWLLKFNFIGEIIKLKALLKLPEEMFQSPEVQEAAKKSVSSHVLNRLIDTVLEIKQCFKLSEEIFKEGIKDAIILILNSGQYDNLNKILKIKETLPISNEIFKLPEVVMAFKKCILNCFSTGNNILNMSEYIGKIFNASEDLFELFKFELFEFEEIFLKLISNIDLNFLSLIRNEFPKLFIKIIQSPKIQEMSRQVMLQELLSLDDINNAVKIKELFNLSVQDLQPLLSNGIKNKIEIIEEVIPGFEQKIFSSLEILASVLQFSFEDIQLLIKNPTLFISFEENPSMAIKLLIQYPKFSESPKENIDTILEIKRNITEYHPDIDSNSHEFRLLVQEQLKLYRRNMDILSQMKEGGVNIDQWLNYSEETLFELGGEEASYAELIKLPSERIQKIIQRYEEEVKAELSKYKKELLDKKISLIDISEIEQKIMQMDKLVQEAKSVGNEEKAKGIQRGIEGLKKQLENPKQIPAWLKIMSDVDTVSKLFSRAVEINTQIANFDIEIKSLTQNPSKESQKKMFDNKKKIKELSKEFISLLDTTSTRMDLLLVSIGNSLSQTLGEDISKKIISSLNIKLSEDQEHFNSDKGVLKDILKINDSDNDVRGTLLKIKVWDRNPDIDLYMGNYSDCCVRIDSEYHGSESPISDYITDLGMQIVSVYDEKTGKPFAAAWCFVGVDNQGNKAFVVDNIEAVGPYMQYSHDITEKLKTYIEKYAKASGLEIISQGPYNNDMVVTTNLEEKYTKLGGYNKENGYYLEAEPDDEFDDEPDDEFDDENEDEVTEEESEEQRLINEYTRTQENIVSLEEAFNRNYD